MVIGYELATRAAMALHATVSDYHTSGAWNALATAAVGARIRGLDGEALRQAIGIAEYHGPRSQMMREIDNPSMLHDGSGWGALAGATATVLAEKGFTGAPAITVEGEGVAPFWSDLGSTWLTAEHYIKPYPVCRWAHAVIDGALSVRNAHGLSGDDVQAVEIATYLDAAKLATDMPKTTAKAQYSLAYPVAAALQRGRVGVDEVMGSGFDDSGISRLVAATSVREEPAYNPPRTRGRPSEVTLVLRDGRRVSSGKVVPRGGPDEPLSRAEVGAKFHEYAVPLLGDDRATAIEQAVYALAEPEAELSSLLDIVLVPPPQLS
jgi:2-methylcitrate dehydratase PrpD